MSSLETHRSFVNTWECDENVHLNVQFYWQRFGEASQFFAQLTETEPQRWIDRHVRYHAELGLGANTIVNSSSVADAQCLLHVLKNGETGALSATSIDRVAKPIGANAFQVSELPEEAVPRSLSNASLNPIDVDSVLNDGRGLVTSRTVVTPNECDETGVLLDQYHISRFSDAASHFWQHVGINRIWLQEQNLGTVAVEMKVTRHALPKVGMLLEVVTWLDEVHNKTLSFRHQVQDLKTKEIVLSSSVTALLMDLGKRKAIVLPAKIRERV